ncbi:MAG TPA: hypothetical protein VGK16_13660 [Candidatus Limnocylindrales bacterium]
MFAMLHGPLPAPADGADPLHDAVTAQLAGGLDLVTEAGSLLADRDAALLRALDEGDTGPDGLLVRVWRATATAAASMGESPVAVAATVTGPYTLATRHRGLDPVSLGERLLGELVALAAAGCPLVVVDEPEAVGIGADDRARTRFRDAQRALLPGDPPLHAMLAITGGSAWDAGPATILDAPYASYLLDLVAGPDNWDLARAVPGDRGIVCAALRAPSAEDQAPLLVWAAQYAASMNGRGLARVGLANASPLGGLDPELARGALVALGRAARFAAMDPDAAIADGLDRRTFAQPPGRGARRRGLRRS